MWLDLAIALSCSGGGLVCGWIMHAIFGSGNYKLVQQAAASLKKSEMQGATKERITEVAERLKDYAFTMAADVDAHQTRVQAVNNTLIEADSSSPEAVSDAVGHLIEANEAMQTQLLQAQDRIHEQTAQIESAERRAHTDALTRVPNRAAFDKHIQKQHALGAGEAGTLALLDVDNFKQFNDVYGHRAGDEVLRVVASVLYARLQPYGLVARFGGEEFAVILDGYSVDQAKELVELARIDIGERDIQFEDKRLRVTASAGVAELLPMEDTECWLQRADDAMYRSKEQGRNCGHWMDGGTPIRIELSKDSASMSSFEKAKAWIVKSSPHAQESKPPQTPENPTPAEDSQLQNTAEPAETGKSSQKVDPSAFAYIPDRATLGTAFTEIRGRTQSSVSLFVMAIHLSSATSNASMRSLLQIVRATLRSVDQIGCDDDSTLLVCMPSVDAATACERGHQICRSAEAIGLQAKDSSERQVSVGIAETGPGEEFDLVVSRAALLAQQARAEDSDPVCLEGQHASV